VRKQRVDIRDCEPTRVVLDVTFTSNGGTITNDRLDRVYSKTLLAFAEACEAEGMDSGQVVQLRCMMPKRFDAWDARVFKREYAQQAELEKA
jgi:hypothetical protein